MKKTEMKELLLRNSDRLKRHLARAIIFSILANLLYIFISILSGLFLTYFYVPDITNAYEEVHDLQNEVAFGVIIRSDFETSILLHLLVGIGIYGLLITAIRLFKKLTSSKVA
jgi:quinol-cytochrome oxidoreductase complex cytochrome b subunit